MIYETHDGTSPVDALLERVARDAGVPADEVRAEIASLLAESSAADMRGTIPLTPEGLILSLTAQVLDRMQNTTEPNP